LAVVRGDPAVRRLVGILFLTHLLAMAGAATLISIWVRSGAPSVEALGLVAGAVVLGVLAGGLAFDGLSGQPARPAVVALGYLAGGGAVALAGGSSPLVLLGLAAALVLGAGTASIIPTLDELLSRRVPPGLRGRAGGFAAMGTYAGLPVAAVASAWLLGHATLAQTMLVTAAAYLVATTLPILSHRTWRQLDQAPAPAAGLTGAAKLTARVTVTLAYANGEWIVQVRNGRALLGSRHLVKPAEALDLLSRLDLPGVRGSIERALTSDQIEAASQAERMRGQLAEVESKLANVTEMLEITDLKKAT
jgi:MFS family permease